MIDVGRICVKTAGREAGRYCVVVKQVDDTFVLITGPKGLTKVKRRRCNVDHLRALNQKISIKSDAPDSDVEQALKKGNVMQKIQDEPLEKQMPEVALDDTDKHNELKTKVENSPEVVARPGFREAAKAIKASEAKAAKEAKPEAKKGLRHKLGLRRKKEPKDKKPEHKPKPKAGKPKHEKKGEKAKKHARKAEKKPVKHKAAKNATKPKAKSKKK